ncbi:MAG: protoheme IX farnesyltransferase [Candidatus Glassbacteria bacterium]|nr:protoheme IX farnesyltransferase [Candidatus Glassbacteria bacterium]
MKSYLYNLFLLTKPRIGLLVLLTGAAALVVEGSFNGDPGVFVLAMAGLLLVSGSANALNQYFERELDALMSRTRAKRPLPLRRLEPSHAFVFAVLLGVAGVALFAGMFNLLSAALALFAVLFYGVFYTVWLKPRTHLNIVIGGAAGALAPVIAWAAAAGTVGWPAVVMFLVIFFWSPPHFWALAIYLKQDYQAARLPMLPIVKGDIEASRQILSYTVVTVCTSLLLLPAAFGAVYAAACVVLGGLFVYRAARLKQLPSPAAGRSLFGYSIVYLCLLFVAVIVQSAV